MRYVKVLLLVVLFFLVMMFFVQNQEIGRASCKERVLRLV